MTPRRVRALGVGVLWLLWAALAWAQAVLPVPELRSRLIDQTGTLDAAQQASLESRLAAFEAQRGTQIVVVLVPTTQPEDIADYTQRLGDAWKIGRQDVGDGVLFVVAKNDRRVRIATSKTLEGAIPDLVARRIIDQAVTPAFRRNDFAGGIGAGVDQIIAHVSGENLPLPDGGAAEDAGFAPMDLLIFLVFAVPMFSAVLRSLFGNKLGTLLTGAGAGAIAWVLTAVVWIAVGAGLLAMLAALFLQMLPSTPSSGRGRHGGWGGGGFGGGGRSGGGGFSSGGGGNFGGGGASGSW
ncbi:TPM domain-containing protein [Hydrogenophaga flava]|uniref:TPM domain-containing protein n=1 Tax=Hydrogenophaga flava TaxID=65657 RepID=UPI00082606BE|nr:TPM domain-containing protein [Hydrogenophaga flava]